MSKKVRIKIHPLLLPLFILFLIKHQGSLFLLFTFFVTVHELGHCVTALLFGAKIKQIWFTPIGERAMIQNLEQLPYGKRQLVLLAGPAASFLLGFFILLVFHHWEYANINWVIGGFNLLPFVPMDGGGLILNFVGKRIGTVKTAGILIKMSQGFSCFLILCGIVQIVLFPFNFSLLVIGIYFISIYRREYVHITYRVYKELLSSPKRILPIRHVYVGETMCLGELVATMNVDYYFLFYREKNGKIERKGQNEIIYGLMKRGAAWRVWQT